MARKRSKKRGGARRAARRVYRRARAVARRVSRRIRRKRRPSNQLVVVSARRPAKRRSSKAARFGRRGIQRGEIGHTAAKVGIGVGGAVVTSALAGMIPGVSTRGKALAVLGLGAVAYMMVPKKNRMIRYAAAGAAIAGGLSLTKQFAPGVPMLAGLDDIYMGMNIRPRMTPDTTAAWRAQMYTQNKAKMIERTISPSRNVEFMGGGTGSQFGQFLTPANT